MLRSLGRIPAVVAQSWPALLAWYLGGSLVRAAVLALAAPIGPESPLAALLLVPIAVLARLTSYIGMFLVVRRGLRGYQAIAGRGDERQTLRESAAEFSRILLATIVPFFTLYGLLGLVGEDLSDYARAAFRYSLGSNGVLNVGSGPLVLAVVVIAFAGRMLLKYLGGRLPEWLKIVEIYLDATWVFVALTGLGALFGSILGWIQNRQVVHWVVEARTWLTELWTPIKVAVTGIDFAVPVLLQLVLLPLAWILIAGVIYLRSLEHLVRERLIPVRVEAALRVRLARLPPLVRSRIRLAADSWNEVGGPLASAARLVLRARPLNLAVFVFAYAVLYAAGQWLTRGVYAAIGAHDSLFWFTVDPIVALTISAIVEPLRVVLLAVAFDACLGLWWGRRQPSSANRSTVPPRLVRPEPLRERSSVGSS